jgi:hypothetical protein
LVGWLGVALGLLYPATPARANRGSLDAATVVLAYQFNVYNPR